MKTPDYIEGPEALRNFKRGMVALFQVYICLEIVNALIACYDNYESPDASLG
jgi:hypothetical protein